MRCNPEVESWESDPQLCKAFVCDSLAHGIEDVLVRIVAFRIFGHLLNLGFGVVKGETAE